MSDATHIIADAKSRPQMSQNRSSCTSITRQVDKVVSQKYEEHGRISLDLERNDQSKDSEVGDSHNLQIKSQELDLNEKVQDAKDDGQESKDNDYKGD